MNEHSDDSKVVNNSLEVPDQVQAKKRNEAHNKRDATVWKNSRHQVLRTLS